jgi:hypothetical protein
LADGADEFNGTVDSLLFDHEIRSLDDVHGSPNVGFGSIVLKKSLPKFRVAESKKNRPLQPRSDGLNVEIGKASNCRGRRDAKFGRPFAKTEFFNTIGRKRTPQRRKLRCADSL